MSGSGTKFEFDDGAKKFDLALLNWRYYLARFHSSTHFPPLIVGETQHSSSIIGKCHSQLLPMYTSNIHRERSMFHNCKAPPATPNSHQSIFQRFGTLVSDLQGYSWHHNATRSTNCSAPFAPAIPSRPLALEPTTTERGLVY